MSPESTTLNFKCKQELQELILFAFIIPLKIQKSMTHKESLLKDVAAVPVADPRQRTLQADFESKPIPSPIHPLDYDPGLTEYTHLGGEHYILNL